MNDDDIQTINITGFSGAGQPSYTINTGAGLGGSNGLTGGYGVDTITLDQSIYSSGTSITVPSSVTWSQGYSANSTWSNTTANVNIDTDGISIKEGGDIKIAGKSLSDAIEKIEARLGILNPNPELEDRWDQLKELRKQYIELEKDLLEKEKLMKILKEK
jgi:hypothetical protein